MLKFCLLFSFVFYGSFASSLYAKSFSDCIASFVSKLYPKNRSLRKPEKNQATKLRAILEVVADSSDTKALENLGKMTKRLPRYYENPIFFLKDPNLFNFTTMEPSSFEQENVATFVKLLLDQINKTYFLQATAAQLHGATVAKNWLIVSWANYQVALSSAKEGADNSLEGVKNALTELEFMVFHPVNHESKRYFKHRTESIVEAKEEFTGRAHPLRKKRRSELLPVMQNFIEKFLSYEADFYRNDSNSDLLLEVANTFSHLENSYLLLSDPSLFHSYIFFRQFLARLDPSQKNKLLDSVKDDDAKQRIEEVFFSDVPLKTESHGSVTEVLSELEGQLSQSSQGEKSNQWYHQSFLRDYYQGLANLFYVPETKSALLKELNNQILNYIKRHWFANTSRRKQSL